MRVIRAEDLKIEEIIRVLQQSGTIIYPTETCYGLGADVRDAAAVEKVFAIKHRPLEKSALMIMSDIAMAKEYVVWNAELEKIAEKYWPGPLTVVAQSRSDVFLPAGVRRDDGTIAFRISDHPLVNKIVQALGAPLLSTSANIAAEPTLYSGVALIERFQNSTPQPDVIIDAGELPLNPPSTIISLEHKKWQVIRQGAIVVDEVL